MKELKAAAHSVRAREQRSYSTELDSNVASMLSFYSFFMRPDQVSKELTVAAVYDAFVLNLSKEDVDTSFRLFYLWIQAQVCVSGKSKSP